MPGLAWTEIPKIELAGRAERVAEPHDADFLRRGKPDGAQRSAAGRSESTQVAGNIDRRQTEAMPLQGGNWLELSLLIKGVTTKNVTNSPGVGGTIVQPQPRRPADQAERARSGSGEPRFSREAIADSRSSPATSTSPGPLYGGAGQAIRTRDRRLSGAVCVLSSVTTRQRGRSGRQRGAAGLRTNTDRVRTRWSGRERSPRLLLDRRASSNNPATVSTQPPQLGGSAIARRARRSRTAAGARRLARSPHQDPSIRGRYWRRRPVALGADLSVARHIQVAGPRQRRRDLVVSPQQTRVGQLLIVILAAPHFHAPVAQRLRGAAGRLPGCHDGRAVQLPEHRRHAYVAVRHNETWTSGKHDFKSREFDQGARLGHRPITPHRRTTFRRCRRPPMARRLPIDQRDNPAAWDLTGLDASVQRFDLNATRGQRRRAAWNYDVPRPTYVAW